jgi:hypothetical protein
MYVQNWGAYISSTLLVVGIITSGAGAIFGLIAVTMFEEK